MKNRKIILSIIIIALSLTIIFVCSFFKPKTNNNKQNITYKNGLFVDNDYGYEFQTPDNFILTDAEDFIDTQKQNSLIGRRITISEDNGGPWQISLLIERNTGINSPEQWPDLKNDKNFGKVILERRIKIDGYDGILSYYKTNEEQKIVIFIKDNLLYEISMRGRNGESVWQDSDYEKIWKSFKFLK